MQVRKKMLRQLTRLLTALLDQYRCCQPLITFHKSPEKGVGHHVTKLLGILPKHFIFNAFALLQLYRRSRWTHETSPAHEYLTPSCGMPSFSAIFHSKINPTAYRIGFDQSFALFSEKAIGFCLDGSHSETKTIEPRPHRQIKVSLYLNPCNH